MLFSVIIPLYNKETYIAKTIEMVLAQSCNDYELIIVDDGSSDHSFDVAKSYMSEKVRVYQKNNGGVSSARNYGFNMSKGEYVVFLDADDKWESDYLAVISELIDSYPNASAFSTAYSICNSKGVHVDISLSISKGIIHDYCYECYKMKFPIINVDTTCIKREVFTKVGGFVEGVKYGEDIDFWLKVNCNYDLAYTNKVKSHYQIDTLNNSTVHFCPDLTKYTWYWDWYGYDYRSTSSLYLYASDKIIRRFQSIIKNRAYSTLLIFAKGYSGVPRKILFWKSIFKALCSAYNNRGKFNM